MLLLESEGFFGWLWRSNGFSWCISGLKWGSLFGMSLFVGGGDERGRQLAQCWGAADEKWHLCHLWDEPLLEQANKQKQTLFYRVYLGKLKKQTNKHVSRPRPHQFLKILKYFCDFFLFVP